MIIISIPKLGHSCKTVKKVSWFEQGSDIYDTILIKYWVS